MKAIVYRTFFAIVDLPDHVFAGVDVQDEFALRKATLECAKVIDLPDVGSMNEVEEEFEIELLGDDYEG